MKHLRVNKIEEADDFWAEGDFSETLGSIDMEEKMKTFHKKHDEDVNYDCKKCNKKISAHNRDWHNGMCDDCFNREVYPEDQAAYEQRLIQVGGKKIDPIGLSQDDFEKELGLTWYIEAKMGKENKAYMDVFFAFLEMHKPKEVLTFRLYDGEVTDTVDMPLKDIKENLYLLCQNQGFFADDDDCVSQAFTDKKTFYASVQEGMIFFSGNDPASEAMKEVFKEEKVDFHLEETKEYLDL